jgi:hypothetical protein
MQKHEGPRRDADADERSRQWVVTKRLLLAILTLSGLLGATLYDRLM